MVARRAFVEDEDDAAKEKSPMTKQLIPTQKTLPPAFGGSVLANAADLRSVIEQAKQAWLSKTESE